MESKSFEQMAVKLGGEIIPLSGNATSVNIFDINAPTITKEGIDQKEKQLRALLTEANKDGLLGSEYAAVALNNLSDLEDSPEWMERATTVLQEFADMRKMKYIREKTGMSQTQFATYLDIPVRTLQEWEQERCTPPDYVIKMIWRILQLENKVGSTDKLKGFKAAICKQIEDMEPLTFYNFMDDMRDGEHILVTDFFPCKNCKEMFGDCGEEDDIDECERRFLEFLK